MNKRVKSVIPQQRDLRIMSALAKRDQFSYTELTQAAATFFSEKSTIFLSIKDKDWNKAIFALEAYEQAVVQANAHLMRERRLKGVKIDETILKCNDALVDLIHNMIRELQAWQLDPPADLS